MSKPTFAERCLLAEQCLPDAPYRAMLKKLHSEMLEALAEQPAQQEPDYAWPTVADYERDVGFQTNEAFRMAWNMARTTNKMLGHTSPPAQRPWVYLTDAERQGLWRVIIRWGDPSHNDEDLMKAIEDASRRKNQ